MLKEMKNPNVEKLAYLAFEDQCSPANPRVPMVEDMKQILTDAFYNEEFLAQLQFKSAEYSLY